MEKTVYTEKEIPIFRHGQNGYREYRIPAILPLPDGTLLLACEARAEDRGDWGDIDDIICRVTEDREIEQTFKMGLSHLPPDGTMRTHNNPVLIPDGDTVHFIYHKNYEQVFICSSKDGGRTWGESREITECYREFPFDWNVCATGPGHGIQMSNGRLVVPIWLANGSIGADGKTRRHWPSVAGCIYSDDHGQTWHAGALADGILDGNETTVAQLPDGRLLFNYRTRDEHHLRTLGLSDNGETMEPIWACPALEDPWCFGAMVATENGVIFGNCASTSKRVDATVKYSKDAGKTWDVVWQVSEKAGYIDVAYSNHRIYAFYEQGSSEEKIIKELTLKISSEITL